MFYRHLGLIKHGLASLFLLISLSATSANAALIGTCTFSGGCSPDMFLSVSSASFSSAGNGGTLTLSGSGGNASFAAGELQDYAGGLTSVNIAAQGGFGDANWSISIAVDGSGNFDGAGAISVNGEIIDAATFNVANIAASGNPWLSLVSANGTSMAGDLVDGTVTDAGTQVNASGGNVSSVIVDFRFDQDPSSVMYQAGFQPGAGVIALSNLSVTDPGDVWNSSWTASTATVDVVLPVPGAAWFFASALMGLTAVRRKVSQAQ